MSPAIREGVSASSFPPAYRIAKDAIAVPYCADCPKRTDKLRGTGCVLLSHDNWRSGFYDDDTGSEEVPRLVFQHHCPGMMVNPIKSKPFPPVQSKTVTPDTGTGNTISDLDVT